MSEIVLAADEAPPEARRERRILGLTAEAWLRFLAPALIGALALTAWEWAVRVNEVRARSGLNRCRAIALA